jgi:pyruvate kinase
VELVVEESAPGRVRARVVVGGTLTSRKGLHVPGVPLRVGAMTGKDAEDLAAGIAMGVDAVAVSFVQSADDLRADRNVAVASGAPTLPLVAKIERAEAVERLDEILDEADGLMVARGDLGIELPLETLPTVQRELLASARRRGVPAIVATEVLESMREAPRPTRAEVTDAAHAVEQGADAIMLAGETAVGRYPVQAVAALDRIIREAERAGSTTSGPAGTLRGTVHARGLCEAAMALAARVSAAAIVALTETGTTARLLAALRPGTPIVAVTPHAELARQLTLVWGLQPLVVAGAALPDVRRALGDAGVVPSGAVVVFIAVQQALAGEPSNFVHVETI